MSLVSIIIPTKNRSSQLRRAVLSCLNQSHKDIEIIVVDDSSDEELKPSLILQDINDKKIKIIELDVSVGGGEARNIGVDESNGHYITFLDSDDAYFQDCIEQHIKFHENEIENEKLITYGKGLRSKFKGMKFIRSLSLEPSSGKAESQNVATYLFSGKGRMFTPTLFLKKTFFNNVRFNKLLKRHQDYGFVLEAEKSGARFKFVDKPLFYWISDEQDEGAHAKSINIQTCMFFLEQYDSYLSKKEVELYLKNILAPVALRARDVNGFYNLFINKEPSIIKAFLKSTLYLSESFAKLFFVKYFK